MRPVDKGTAPNVYSDYGDARHDLAARIGYYCSYCEMAVKNMIEVEHVHPIDKGGAELDWNNFLLGCKYCNTVKSNDNDDRNGYLWPDIDNTDLVFDYSETDVIQTKTTLPTNLQTLATSTISLTGLNRIPSGINEPTEADTRWRSRKEAWDMAKKSLNDWLEAPIPQMARQMARTSLASGHYSIWMKVFEKIDDVKTEIDLVYRTVGLFKEFQPGTTTRTIRINGQI